MAIKVTFTKLCLSEVKSLCGLLYQSDIFISLIIFELYLSTIKKHTEKCSLPISSYHELPKFHLNSLYWELNLGTHKFWAKVW